MTYCQMVNFAKQLAIRTTSWGGFFEFCMTIAMAFVKNVANPGTSDLYNTFEIAFIKSDSCGRTSRAWGHMLSLMISVETAEETYYEQLTFSLADD